MFDSSGQQTSTSTVITSGNTAPTVTVTAPLDGGLFSFGDDLAFKVTVTDPEDPSINCADVQVTFVLGHDEHGHAEQSTNGCTGILSTDAEDVAHGGNVFGVISASYTDKGSTGGVPPLSTTSQVQIRQKHQEVENVVTQSGTNMATTTDVGGGSHRGSLGGGRLAPAQRSVQPAPDRLDHVPRGRRAAGRQPPGPPRAAARRWRRSRSVRTRSPGRS